MKKYMYGLMITVSVVGTAVYGDEEESNPCPRELRVNDLENLSSSGKILNPKNRNQDLALKSVELSPSLQSKYNKIKTNKDTAQHKLKAMLPGSWQILSRGIITEGRAKAERTGEPFTEEGKVQCTYKYADLLGRVKGAVNVETEAFSNLTVEVESN